MDDVVFTSFFLIEIYFTIVLVVNCAIDELLPNGGSRYDTRKAATIALRITTR